MNATAESELLIALLTVAGVLRETIDELEGRLRSLH